MTNGNADGTGDYDAPAPKIAEGSVASSNGDGAGFVKYSVEGFFIGPGDTGAARLATAATGAPRLYPSSGYQTSGWCHTCGRRRGADGRCANCDPWWTSPLLMVGLPCVAVTCFGLFLLVTALGGKRPDAVAINTAVPSVLSAPDPSSAFSGPPSPGSPVRTASVLSAPPPVYSLPASSAPSGPTITLGPLPTARDRFLQRYAEQESLRQTTSLVDSAISQDMSYRERAEAQSRDAFSTETPQISTSAARGFPMGAMGRRL